MVRWNARSDDKRSKMIEWVDITSAPLVLLPSVQMCVRGAISGNATVTDVCVDLTTLP